VSACPSTELAGVCYLVVTPFGEHLRAVAGQRRVLIVGALRCSAWGFVCSRLFVPGPVGPIGLITAGILALEKRRWRHRLPDLGEDEFGDLGRAMNRLSEGMLEIDRATEVQMKMIPKILPTPQDYEVGVHFQRPRIWGAITGCHGAARWGDRVRGGDVTGHGIGSALLTASAKVMFYQMCQAGRRRRSFSTPQPVHPTDPETEEAY